MIFFVFFSLAVGDRLFGHDSLRNSGQHRAALSEALDRIDDEAWMERRRSALADDEPLLSETRHSAAHSLSDATGSIMLHFDVAVKRGTVHLDDLVELVAARRRRRKRGADHAAYDRSKIVDDSTHNDGSNVSAGLRATCNATHLCFTDDNNNNNNDDDDKFELARQVALVAGRGGALTSATLQCAGSVEHLLARVRSIDVDGSCISIVPLANPFELFGKGSSLRFETSRLPHLKPSGRRSARHQAENKITAVTGDNDDDRSSRKRFNPFGAIGKFFVDAVKHVENALNDIKDAVETAVVVLKDLGNYVATGKLEGRIYGTLYEADWNYDANTKSALKGKFYSNAENGDNCNAQSSLGCIVCENCFYTMDVGILFKWNVTQYSTLRDFALLLRGDVAASFNLHAKPHASLSGNLQLFRDVLLPEIEVQIQIGPVPLFIAFTLDVELGVRGELKLAASSSALAANVTIDGCAEYGFEMSAQSGSIEPVDRIAFEQKAALIEQRRDNSTVVVDAVLGAYVTSRTYIKLEKIGGPYILVEPSIELAINGIAPPRLLDVCTNLNWGIDVGIGGFIDIKLGELELVAHEWPATLVVQQKSTLYSSCDDSRRRRRQAALTAPPLISAGKTWSGYQTGCVANLAAARAAIPYFLMSVSMQALDSPAADGSFTVGVKYFGRFGDYDNPLVLVARDRDEDSVADFRADRFNTSITLNDLCSYSMRPTVGAFVVNEVGCAPGQLPDTVDGDRDGVPNIAGGGPIDRCPVTRNGWRAVVNRNASSSEYGCSACDLEPARCSGAANGDSDALVGVKCSLFALYEARPSRSVAGMYHFERVVQQSLNFSGGWRVDGTRNMASLDPVLECLRSSRKPGCSCDQFTDRNRCDNDVGDIWQCNKTISIGGGVLRGMCVDNHTNQRSTCVAGKQGCLCRGAGYCDHVGNQCVAGFCVVVGVPHVPIRDAGGRYLGVEDVKRDASFGRICSAFTKTIDLVPVERFSGRFAFDNAQGRVRFSSHVVLAEAANETLDSFDKVAADSTCPEWALFADDEQSISLSLFDEPVRMARTKRAAGDVVAASPALSFRDTVLVNITKSIGTPQCKYNDVVGINLFKVLDKAKALGEILKPDAIAAGAKAGALGIVKNSFDYTGSEKPPQATLPKNANNITGVGIAGNLFNNGTKRLINNASSPQAALPSLWLLLSTALVVVVVVVEVV